MYIYTSIFYLLWLHVLINLTNQDPDFCEFSTLENKIAVAGLFFDKTLV